MSMMIYDNDDNLVFPTDDPEAFLKFLKELGEAYGFTDDSEAQEEEEASGSKEGRRINSY